MKRIMLTVAYDGTNYCGWQMEPTGLSVEEVLNKALSKRFNEDIHVKGVSRTDSGVHALANLCIFDTETPIPPEKICFAVNEVLPEDIVVRKSEEVPPDFHPRKCDSLKTYEYTLYHDSLPNPLVRHYTTYYYRRLDVQKMREGAAYLIGEHDFSSFCSAGSQAETKVRRITALEIEEEGTRICFRITGTGFLYNMVRIIVGTLLRTGTGFWPPEKVKEILEAKDRQAAGPKVEARGEVTGAGSLPPVRQKRSFQLFLSYCLPQAPVLASIKVSAQSETGCIR